MGSRFIDPLFREEREREGGCRPFASRANAIGYDSVRVTEKESKANDARLHGADLASSLKLRIRKRMGAKPRILRFAFGESS